MDETDIQSYKEVDYPDSWDDRSVEDFVENIKDHQTNSSESSTDNEKKDSELDLPNEIDAEHGEDETASGLTVLRTKSKICTGRVYNIESATAETFKSARYTSLVYPGHSGNPAPERYYRSGEVFRILIKI